MGRLLGVVALAAASAIVAASCHSGATSYIVVESPPPPAGATAPVTRASDADTVVSARFRNVHFHYWPGVSLDLDRLEGRMQSTRADHVVSFDDKRSFLLAIDSGVVGLTTESLANLMNTYVFAYRGAPLRGLRFETVGGRLVQRGILHKVVDIPFEMTAEVSTTADGEIRVHPVTMKICSIDGKGLMDALGITLEKLLDVRKAKGVRVDKNDLLLDPTKLLPPPKFAGHLTAIGVEPGRLVQYFTPADGGPPSPAMTPDSAAANYMLFRGGTLQFGKLFMVHADMQVVDLEPADPFEFDIGRYREQLVAGYHRTLTNDGLLVFMPDIGELPLP